MAELGDLQGYQERWLLFRIYCSVHERMLVRWCIPPAGWDADRPRQPGSCQAHLVEMLATVALRSENNSDIQR